MSSEEENVSIGIVLKFLINAFFKILVSFFIAVVRLKSYSHCNLRVYASLDFLSPQHKSDDIIAT